MTPSTRTKFCKFCGNPSGTRSYCSISHKHKWLRRNSKKVILNQAYLTLRSYYFYGKTKDKRNKYARAREHGVLLNFSYCLSCNEIMPFVLVEHHIFKRKDSDFSITLCWNCHRLVHKLPKYLYKKIEENI